MVKIRRRPLPRHGTDHDSKPLPPFPRFCLSARPLQCGQEEYRSGRATAQGFGRSLLALPFAGARLTPFMESGEQVSDPQAYGQLFSGTTAKVPSVYGQRIDTPMPVGWQGALLCVCGP